MTQPMSARFRVEVLWAELQPKNERRSLIPESVRARTGWGKGQERESKERKLYAIKVCFEDGPASLKVEPKEVVLVLENRNQHKQIDPSKISLAVGGASKPLVEGLAKSDPTFINVPIESSEGQLIIDCFSTEIQLVGGVGGVGAIQKTKTVRERIDTTPLSATFKILSSAPVAQQEQTPLSDSEATVETTAPIGSDSLEPAHTSDRSDQAASPKADGVETQREVIGNTPGASPPSSPPQAAAAPSVYASPGLQGPDPTVQEEFTVTTKDDQRLERLEEKLEEVLNEVTGLRLLEEDLSKTRDQLNKTRDELNETKDELTQSMEARNQEGAERKRLKESLTATQAKCKQLEAKSPENVLTRLKALVQQLKQGDDSAGPEESIDDTTRTELVAQLSALAQGHAAHAGFVELVETLKTKIGNSSSRRLDEAEKLCAQGEPVAAIDAIANYMKDPDAGQDVVGQVCNFAEMAWEKLGSKEFAARQSDIEKCLQVLGISLLIPEVGKALYIKEQAAKKKTVPPPGTAQKTILGVLSPGFRVHGELRKKADVEIAQA